MINFFLMCFLTEPIIPDDKIMEHSTHRVLVVGGGSWGTTLARIAAERVRHNSAHGQYIRTVKLWLKDEKMPDGRLLSESINDQHENKKYLPGVKLPDNLVAEPDLEVAAAEATLIIFAIPHKFIHKGIFVKLLARCSPNCRVLSLVKCVEKIAVSAQCMPTAVYPDCMRRSECFPPQGHFVH